MAKRDNNVYILGAGFSADAGIPVMAAFLQHAYEAYESPAGALPFYVEPHYEAVLRRRIELKRCRDAVKLDLDNIEQLFGLIDMEESLGHGHRDDISIKHVIAHLVTHAATQDISYRVHVETRALSLASGSAVLNRFCDPMVVARPGRATLRMKEYELAVAILAGMFEPDAAGVDNTIVTFNYDVQVENAAARLDLWPDYGISRTRYAGARTNPGKSLAVRKLHGSSNWAYVRQRATRAHIYDSYDDFGANNAPIIVPPTWKKGQFSPLLGEVWAGALKALSKATRICVIGYSMPETDLHFQYLMASALAANPALYGLTVVDIGTLSDRYAKLFVPLVEYGRLKFVGGGLDGFLTQKQFKRLGRGTGIEEVIRV